MAITRNEKYGKGEVTLDIDTALALPENLLHELRALFQSPQYQPPVLPETALRLIELSQMPNVDMSKVADLLEQDAMLAARLLRIAQTPFYSGNTPVRSLRDALVRMGLKNATDVFMEVALQARVFKAKGYGQVMSQLQRHSSAVANIAKLICARLSLYDDYAFLCGLLHDVGIAASVIAVSQATPKKLDTTLLWPAIREVHESAAAVLAASWKLPTELTLVIGHHHSVVIDGHAHPIAAAISLADVLAHELGYGVDPELGAYTAEIAVKALNVSEPTLQSLRVDAERLLKSREATE